MLKKKIIPIVIAIILIIVLGVIIKNCLLIKKKTIYIERGDTISLPKRVKTAKSSDKSIALLKEGKIFAEADGDADIVMKKGFIFKETYHLKVRSIDKDMLLMQEGSTERISSTLEGASWESDNNSSINIDPDEGIVTALKAGEANITCKAHGLCLKCKVYSPTVKQKELNMKSTSEEKLDVMYSPYNAEFNSKNAEVAKVSKEGTVTAVGNGNTEIECKVGDITINIPVNVLSLNKTQLTISKGQEFQLSANADEIKWSIDDREIAEIDETGKISGVKPGITIAHASRDNVVMDCRVNVAAFENASYEKDALSEAFLPKVLNANEDITYIVGDNNVAVAESGKIYIKGIGSTTITAKTGECTLTCSLVVKIPDNIVNPLKNIPVNSKEDRVVVTMKGYPQNRQYTAYSQEGKLNQSERYPKFIKESGDAACAAATIVSSLGRDVSPQYIVEEIEKQLIENEWKINYKKDNPSPLTLYGISKVLHHYGLSSKYVSSFDEDSAREQIKAHLLKGYPVLAVVHDTGTITWGGNWHIISLLGMTGKDKVVIADSMGKGSGGIIKVMPLNDVISSISSSEEEGLSCYLQSVQMAGGYLLVSSNN